MGNPFLSIKFSFLLSLSVTASSSAYFLIPKQSSLSSSPIPKASVSDLLSLLGSNHQSSSLNPLVAQQLRSCLKFVVPFTPNRLQSGFQTWSAETKLTTSEKLYIPGPSVVDELIWWPPEPILELARLALDSGGDPAAIHRALDPTVIPVPDVEGCNENRCQLTRTPYGRNFISKEVNSYFEFLFELILVRGPSVGVDISLSRYDLFHGHLFLAPDTGRVGILFHAKEYPVYSKKVFPYNMGYCQIGSNVKYDDSMNFRNILWLAPLPGNSAESWIAPGVLVVLDAHPGGIIYKDLIPDYVKFVRTLYEGDFGDVAVDVNYLNVGDAEPDFRIFIC